MVVDFRAGSADAIGALGRSAGGPEVLVLVFAADAVGVDADLVLPKVVGFVVVFVDGDRQPIGVEAKPVSAGEELPGPGDGFLFEVVAEREVAEHLEGGVVVGGDADVFDVVGAEALLTGGGLGEGGGAVQELFLELVHAGRSEEDGRVVLGDDDVGRSARAAFGLEELEVGFAEVVGFHERSRRRLRRRRLSAERRFASRMLGSCWLSVVSSLGAYHPATDSKRRV